MKKWIVLLCFIMPIAAHAAGDSVFAPSLQKPSIDLTDKASLQRGAKLYMNYCSGCHSLQYVRYQQMGRDLVLLNKKNEVDENLLKENLNFPGTNIWEPIVIAMPPADAKEWFGIVPPDLTLTARSRGVDWLFTYLMSFYQDNKRPWGSNNWLFPDVAMPNVLQNLQGTVVPIFRTITLSVGGEEINREVVDHLQLIQTGSMSEHQFALAINDLVNFLAYTSEPMQLKRWYLGIFVLIFLAVLAVFAYLLKKEYWKAID